MQQARAILPVVVVDDGSTDDTAAQAEAAGATVLIQQPNAGKGAALRRGFRYALDQGCVAIVTLDADGQHDPAEIPQFLAAFEASRPELDHRAPRLQRDAARSPALQLARRRGVFGRRRAEASRTTSPATGSSAGS